MKKRRTREHIIEDLGLNHLERQFCLPDILFKESLGIMGMMPMFSPMMKMGKLKME